MLNAAGVAKHDSVAVFGLGAVGLSAVLGAKVAGADRIVAIDRLETKLSPASSVAATDALVVDERTATHVSDLTEGDVDHAIEASGTLESFDMAVGLVRRSGTVTTLCLPGPAVSCELELARLVASGVTNQGSYLGSWVTSRDVPRFVEMYRKGRFPTGKLISHRIGLDDINVALDRLADGEAL